MSTQDKGWRRDWAIIRSLRGKKLIQYLLDYYTIPFVVTIFAIYFFVSAGFILWEGQQEIRLQVCVVLNNDMVCKAWFDEFFENLRSDGKPGRTILNEDQPFDYDNRYFQIQEAEIMAMISSKRMDVAICGEDLFTYLLALNVCLDLREPSAISKILAENATVSIAPGTAGLTDRPPQEGLRHPDLDSDFNPDLGTPGYYALDLTGTAFAARYNKDSDGPLYAVVISNTEHLDDALTLLSALAL